MEKDIVEYELTLWIEVNIEKGLNLLNKHRFIYLTIIFCLLSAFGSSEIIYSHSAKTNLIIAHPERAIRSLIRITGTDFDCYDFHDNRQCILEYSKTEEHESILLEITRDLTNYRFKMHLPLTEEELNRFAAYLGRDELIDPTSPEIKEIIHTLIGNETDAWQITVKLLEWVGDVLELEASLHPAVEHVILFAALARAAGIPTRIAAGLRYQGGMWVNWLWNEIWVKEWIAVDPAYQQTTPDALLVKLTSAPSLVGLFVFDDLDIRIRSVDFALHADH